MDNRANARNVKTFQKLMNEMYNLNLQYQKLKHEN